MWVIRSIYREDIQAGQQTSEVGGKCLGIGVGPGGIARPFSTQIISVNRDVKQISVGFKKVTVEASEMTVGYMTV